ncbi:O-antigen ligase family protein [Thermodesulfatator indicus]|nr:O-antigen ligase family protein [Thermodesulfatator indicus]
MKVNCFFKLRRESLAKLLVIALFIGGIITDIINGLLGTQELSLSVSAIFRGTIEIVGILVIFLSRKISVRWKALIFVLILLFFLTQIYSFFSNYNVYLFFEISRFFKVLYIPVISMFIYVFLLRYKNFRYLILNTLSLAGFIESLAIIFPFLLGYGKPTYTVTTIGSRGILLSPNEIALSLLIVEAITVWLFLYSKKKIYLLYFVSIVIGMIILATRTSILGSIVVPVIILFLALFCEFYCKRSLSYEFNSIRCIFFLFIVSVTSYNAYVNLLNNEYLIQKILYFLQYFNARGDLQEVGIEVLFNSSVCSILFGNTPSVFFFNVQKEGQFAYYSKIGKNVEVDWIDIWGCYGLIFLIVIYLFYFYFLFASTKKFLMGRKKEFGLITFLLSLFLAHSLLAGHALMAPLPGNYIAPLIAFVLSDRKSKKVLKDEYRESK